MGASKEGMQFGTVRERISLVLRDYYPDEDDPPDSGGGGGETRSSKVVPMINAPSGAPPPSLPPLVSSSSCSSKDAAESLTSSYSNCSKSNRILSSSSSSPMISRSGGSSQEINTSANVGRTSGESEGSSGGGGVGGVDNVIIEESSISSGSSNSREIPHRPHLLLQIKDLGVSGEEGQTLESLRRISKRDCGYFTRLQLYLAESDQALEVVRKERDQLKERLESIVRCKDERIQELEKELAKAIARKPREDKGTCTTPPPPSTTSSTSPIHFQTKSGRDDEHLSHHLPTEDDDLKPPQPKRAKLDMGRRENLSNFLLPPSSQKVFLSASSYQSPRAHQQHYHHHQHHNQRRSDSPPHLSPAVTPKSTLNASGRPREIRSFLGHEVNDVGPPDEFQDELERINRTLPASATGHGSVKFKTAGNHLSQQLFPPSFPSRAQQGSFGTGLTNSNTSGFSRLPTTKPRHTRFMFPEGKKRFMNNNSSSSTSSSFLPVNNKSRLQYPSADFLFPKSINNTMPPSSRHLSQQHAVSRNRSNNFLNLSRPLAKKAPVVIVPPPQNQKASSSTSSSSHFRSLDGAAAASSSAHSLSHRREEEQAALVPSITPPVVKKRKVGRPPGSGLKSKLVPRTYSTSFSSSSSSGTPLQSGQLPNGSVSLQEPPPPQRFSQRGRLLKPNRARYSPDPDVSVNTREKYLTTKKSYFVGEPFVHAEYPGEEGGLLPDESGGPHVSTTPSRDIKMEVEEEEADLPGPENQTSKSKLDSFEDGGSESGGVNPLFVEVPQWRLRIMDGFSEHELKELPPEDDMSDETFLKRHQKLEAKEKQRKRWDSQRMREESYLERLKRKQEERERQKELRRQQRKRNKGRNGASEEESITPNVEEIKAIHIGTELPVGAFGHPLPLVEKVKFQLAWEVTPSTADKTSTSPLQNPVNDEPSGTGSNETEKSRDKTVEAKELSSGISSPLHVPLTASSPSSSSSSLPSIPSPGTSPPPTIFPTCIELVDGRQSVEGAVARSENLDISSSKLDDSLMVLTVGSDNGTELRQEADGDDDMDCEPSSPVFSVDLVDYVNSGSSVDGDDVIESESGVETCDILANPVSPTPSISIPLQTPASPMKTTPLELNCTTSGESRVNDTRPRNSTVVHFPQMVSFPTTGSTSSSSSTAGTTPSSAQSSSSTVSKTSITFFIPNNPLAPRHPHRSQSSSISTSSPLATNKASSSSAKASSSSSLASPSS